MSLTQAIECSYVVDHEATDAMIGQRVKHAAECTGSCCCTNQVLQNQIPANKKSHKFAHCHIAVSIGRSCGFRHAHTKFSIAHPCGEITMITVTPVLLKVFNKSMNTSNWLLWWKHWFFFFFFGWSGRSILKCRIRRIPEGQITGGKSLFIGQIPVSPITVEKDKDYLFSHSESICTF